MKGRGWASEQSGGSAAWPVWLYGGAAPEGAGLSSALSGHAESSLGDRHQPSGHRLGFVISGNGSSLAGGKRLVDEVKSKKEAHSI